MKARLFALIFGLVLGLAGVLGPRAAIADQPGPPPQPHRHYILVDGAKVYVGPNFCEVSESIQGWTSFHYMVHLTDPGLIDVSAEGCP